MDFLDYYRENLSYLRSLGTEFAAEFPKIASRLNLSESECQDPYVERLLEGSAFLSARVEKKLDSGYFRFLETILSSVSPDALNPIASGAVLELGVDVSSTALKKQKGLPEGTLFDASIPKINTPCRFSSLWKTPLSPLAIHGAEYVTRDISRFNLEKSHSAGLLLKLDMLNKEAISAFPISKLALYFNLPDAVSSILLRHICQDVDGVYVLNEEGEYKPVQGVEFEPLAVISKDSMLKGVKGNLSGLRSLQTFLSYPAFFKFVQMKNLLSALNLNANSTEILITFNRRESELINEIKDNTVKTNCVPVVNLFKKRSDRSFLEKLAYEHHVIPERTSMRDFEVYKIRQLEFFNERNETVFVASNFYDEDIASQKDVVRNFFSMHRRESLFEQKKTRRSSYMGSEVYVNISGQNALFESVSQFSADLVCSNRDMPLFLQQHTTLECFDTTVQSASFVSMPTRPKPPLISVADKSDWSRVSHIIFNLSSMLWQDGTFPLETLKTLLANYAIRPQEEMERLIEGIVGLESEPTTFRFVKNGAVFFERGWKIHFTLNEQAYAGIGYYTFATVLKEIFKSFTPLNALLEVEFSTQQSGLITRWKS